MDHFLSGLDHPAHAWYSSRGSLHAQAHEFAVGSRIVASNSGNDSSAGHSNPGLIPILAHSHGGETPSTSIGDGHGGLTSSHPSMSSSSSHMDGHQSESSTCLDISTALKSSSSSSSQEQVMSTQVAVAAAARAAVAKIMPAGSPMTSSAIMQVMQATQVKQEVDRSGSPIDEGVPMGSLLPSQRPKPKGNWNTKKVCSICGKILSRGDKLKNHMKLHSPVLPPSSSSESSLTISDTNATTKSGSRWDTKKICNICGKVLSRGDKLKNHMRIHTNNFPFHCETCGHGFLRSEGLRVHTRIHTGERPYVCLVCGKSYTRKDKLTRHAIVHTGERPFVCQHCNKSFTRKDKMQRHELIHKVEKPFTCVPCNLEFARQEGFNAHMERKHPERLPYTVVQEPRAGVSADYFASLGSIASTASTSTSLSSQAHTSSSSNSKTLAAITSRLPAVAAAFLPMSQ